MNRTLVVCLLALLSLSGAVAYAQESPKFDLFAGYSYVRDNPSTSGVNGFNLNGGSASIAYHFNNWISGVGDFGGYSSSNIRSTGVDGTLSTYLFGPRVYYRRHARFTPFGQVLFGVAHTGNHGLAFSTSNNSFAMSVGGGVDLNVAHRFSIRPVQVDYLLTRFDEFATGRQNQNNLRVSTGIVFHF